MSKAAARIYIVGSSGSGKTTVAKLLALKLGHDHIDLDDLRYPPEGKRLSLDELGLAMQTFIYST